MAKYGTNKSECPFCGAPESSHKLATGGGGCYLHVRCKVCGALGPRVKSPGLNQGWRVVLKGEFPKLAERAWNLWYGEKQPSLSGAIPPHV